MCIFVCMYVCVIIFTLCIIIPIRVGNFIRIFIVIFAMSSLGSSSYYNCTSGNNMHMREKENTIFVSP